MTLPGDDYLVAHPEWAPILEPLLTVLRDQDLGFEETRKWGIPVFTLNGMNVVGLVAFKAYAGLWFYEGALLTDDRGVLTNAGEGKTQSLRQWRFGREDTVLYRPARAFDRTYCVAESVRKRIIRPGERQWTEKK